MKKIISILVSTLIIGGAAYAAGSSLVNDDSARDKAFENAGVTAENVYDLETERDYEKGKEIYEVEFDSNGKEYEYEVDAATGAIIESETEKDDDARKKPATSTTTTPAPKAETTTNTTAGDIGKDGAKAAALQHAGVTEAEVVWEEVERDRDDGRLEYQVEFRVGNKEYDYEIDAVTGKILEFDVEVDD